MVNIVIRSLIDNQKNDPKLLRIEGLLDPFILQNPRVLFDIDIDLKNEDVPDAESLLSLLNAVVGIQDRWHSFRLVLCVEEDRMPECVFIMTNLPHITKLILDTPPAANESQKGQTTFYLMLSGSTFLETLRIKADVVMEEMSKHLCHSMPHLKELELISIKSASSFPSVRHCLNVLYQAPNLQTIRLLPCFSTLDSKLPDDIIKLESLYHAEFSSWDSSFMTLKLLLSGINLPGLTELSISVYNDVEMNDIKRRAQSVRRYRWLRSLLGRSGAFEKIKEFTISSNEEEGVEVEEAPVREVEEEIDNRDEEDYSDKRGLMCLLLDMKSVEEITICRCFSLTGQFLDIIKGHTDSFQYLQEFTFKECRFGSLPNEELDDEAVQEVFNESVALAGFEHLRKVVFGFDGCGVIEVMTRKNSGRSGNRSQWFDVKI